MPIGNSGAIDYSKIDWELSYSPSLEVALNLILGDRVCDRLEAVTM
jgi:hypothetical protein